MKRYGEAVISIETPSGKGSGFILNKDGYAVTNAHVIEGETRIARAMLYQNTCLGGLSAEEAGSTAWRSSRSTRSWTWPLLKLPPQKDLKLGQRDPG